MSKIDISKKVLIITLLIFAVLTAAFTFAHNMQQSNFLELEEGDTLNNVERVQNAVFTEQGYLDYLVRDWACWNDTYRFIDDRNQKFIDVNVQNETLAGLKINVMLFVDNSGSVVYAKAVDINTEEEVSVPQELFEMVKNEALLTRNETDTISGFVLLDKAPMFVSCHPILTTKYKGPVKGTLIFGRYFDDSLLDSFKEATRSSLMMYRVDEELPPEVREKFKDFSKSLESL